MQQENQDITKSSLDPRQNTIDKEGRIRLDWLFSYWIFAWFILYMLIKRAVKESPGAKYIYENMNPLYAYYIAFIENTLALIYIIYSGANMIVIGKYLLMMAVMKTMPIYFLRKEKINMRNNLMWFIILFAIYNVYLYFQETNLYDIYKRTFYLVKENKNKTPFAEFLEYIRSKLFPGESA